MNGPLTTFCIKQGEKSCAIDGGCPRVLPRESAGADGLSGCTVATLWRPHQHQIPHAMSKTLTPCLKFCRGPMHQGVGPKRVIGRGIRQSFFLGQHIQHLFGVGLPIRGAVEIAAGGELTCDQFRKTGINQSTLVVTGLVPRIGKENMHAREARVRDHLFKDFDGIVLNDPHIAQSLLRHLLQKRTHSGGVNLDTEEIHVGPECRYGDRRLAHTKTNLEHRGGIAPEYLRKVQHMGDKFNAIDR